MSMRDTCPVCGRPGTCCGERGRLVAAIYAHRAAVLRATKDGDMHQADKALWAALSARDGSDQ